MIRIGRARAHTNIALIKYWGKRDKAQFLPMNSSLSLTLDAFYTDTEVVFDDSLTEDSFVLNGQQQSQEETAKISRFLDLFRQEQGLETRARVTSYNFVPTAAGLASSASAFAALAMAVHQALALDMDLTELSTYARRGSGSSTRSLFGGFVEWQMGTSSADSQAVPVDAAAWDIGMIVLAINTQKKAVSSRVGMDHTVETSPFYEAWVDSAATDLREIKAAIAARDFQALGEIAEHNGMKMHATTLSAQPPFTYWEPESLRAQQAIRTIREETGLLGYMTMDAGPNVKLLCKASEMAQWVEQLSREFSSNKIITSLPGQGAYYLSEEEWLLSQQAFYDKTRTS